MTRILSSMATAPPLSPLPPSIPCVFNRSYFKSEISWQDDLLLPRDFKTVPFLAGAWRCV
jgi:hypothetical protein